METAFWIIATIVLLFTCGYFQNKAKSYKRLYEDGSKRHYNFTEKALEIEQADRKKLEAEKEYSTALRKKLEQTEQAMQILDKLLKESNRK